MAKAVVLPFAVDLDKFTRGLSDAESSLKKWGKRAGVALAAVAAAGVAAGAALASVAVEIEETQRKVATVFEDSLPVIQAWAKETARAMGLTTNELEGLAANFADLLKPMGFTAAQAADMSMEVIGLAGALAEWSGGQVDATQAAEILSKAMLGERESLKTLGISIMEADVQQRLLQKGQEDLTGAALEQAKAIATQELIFEKSTDAQAAYAEGSETLRRRQAELGATFREVRDRVAEKLIPPLVDLANRITPALIEASDRISAAFDERGVGGAFAEAGQLIKEFWNVTVFPFLQNTVVPTMAALGRSIGQALIDGIYNSLVVDNANTLTNALDFALGPLINLPDPAAPRGNAATGPTTSAPAPLLVPSVPPRSTNTGRTGGIQEFAAGGIVRRPMMGLVGEAGPEAIIPLSKAGGLLGGDQTIIVQVDGSEIARALVKRNRRNLSIAGNI